MIAKKKVVVGLIGIVILWLVMTAYIASNTQEYFNRYLQRVNKLYEKQGVVFALKSFKSALFSSKATLKVDIDEPLLYQRVSKIIKLPLIVEYEIENGPLLFKHGIGMGLSRVRSHIDLHDHVVEVERFKKIFKKGIELESWVDIDFNKNAYFYATTNKIVANVENEKFELLPLRVNGRINLKSFESEMRIELKHIAIEAQDIEAVAQDTLLYVDIKKVYENGFYLGDVRVDIGSLTVKGKDLPFTLEKVKLSILMDIVENRDETIDMKFKLLVSLGNSKLPQAYASLDKIELEYALSGMKLEGVLAFQDFVKERQVRQEELFLKLIDADSGELNLQALEALEKLQDESQDKIFLLLAKMLKKAHTNLNFKMIMVDKKAKESHLKMDITYMGEEFFSTSREHVEERLQKELLELFHFNFDLQFDKAYIANLAPKFQQSLLAQLEMGVMLGMVKESNSSYIFEVDYEAESLMLNGKERLELLQILQMALLRGVNQYK